MKIKYDGESQLNYQKVKCEHFEIKINDLKIFKKFVLTSLVINLYSIDTFL